MPLNPLPSRVTCIRSSLSKLQNEEFISRLGIRHKHLTAKEPVLGNVNRTGKTITAHRKGNLSQYSNLEQNQQYPN